MSINFIYLKYFHDAVKLGSVSAAAKANYVTQSAISQGIAKLEKSLGITLLAHHPNRFRLTPDGESAFAQAWEILRRAAEFKENIGKNTLGNLEFACIYSFAGAVIPKYLKQFKEACPEVNVNFYLGKNADIKQMLKTGVIDFGIGPDEGDLEGWEKHDIHRGVFGLYVSSAVKKKQLPNLGFILAKGECPDKMFLSETYHQKYGEPPQISLEVNSWEVIANLTLEGMGIGYFPDYIALGKKERLRQCDLGLPAFPYRISAYYPKGMQLRKSSQIFLSYFECEPKFKCDMVF